MLWSHIRVEHLPDYHVWFLSMSAAVARLTRFPSIYHHARICFSTPGTCTYPTITDRIRPSFKRSDNLPFGAVIARRINSLVVRLPSFAPRTDCTPVSARSVVHVTQSQTLGCHRPLI